jgi:NAD-dependent SIR2 family protein deacetylase
MHSTLSHQDFNRSVAWDLILEGGDAALKSRATARNNSGPRSTYTTNITDLPPERLVGQHLLSKGARCRCWPCSFKVRQSNLRQDTQALANALGKEIHTAEPEVRTVNRCDTCDKNLCFSVVRNCWVEFHRVPMAEDELEMEWVVSGFDCLLCQGSFDFTRWYFVFARWAFV